MVKLSECYVFILFICIFFFFKQKTAYEMRISDWSSDVCSSDLFCGTGQRLSRLGSGYLGRRPAARRADPADSGNGLGKPYFASGAHGAALERNGQGQIGRASCRERVCQYVSISVAAGSLKKTDSSSKKQH